MFTFIFPVMWMPKTTVVLREDVYEVLKKKNGARGMSKAINEMLADTLLQGESICSAP
jgi:sRNA-binding carbon storage regulator CsrA